jgi:hypothetical protein
MEMEGQAKKALSRAFTVVKAIEDADRRNITTQLEGFEEL